MIAIEKNIPDLRFPEFNDKWKERRIKEITQRYVNPVEVIPDTYYKEIGIRSHGKGLFHKEPILGKELGNKRVFWIKENAFIVNIVFAWEQAIGKTTEKEIGMIASHRFPMYLPRDNKSSVDFLLYFFLTPKGKSLLELASPGGAGRNKTLGQKEFDNVKFYIPEIQEQQKIASFLKSIDKKVDQLEKKKHFLEKYRKGITQKIFSQEIRFKDEAGNSYPDWQKMKLKLVAKKVSSSISANSLLGNSGEYKIYGASGFLQNVDFFQHTVSYISIVKDGAGVGRVKICEPFSSVLGTLESLFPENNVVLEFLYLLMINIDFTKYITGSTIPHIYFKDYGNEKVYIPCYQEQQKIATFLSNIDIKIENLKNEIDNTKIYKKGLMQKMFV